MALVTRHHHVYHSYINQERTKILSSLVPTNSKEMDEKVISYQTILFILSVLTLVQDYSASRDSTDGH